MDVLCLVEPAYFPGSTSDIWPILGGERYRSMHNVIRGTTPHAPVPFPTQNQPDTEAEPGK